MVYVLIREAGSCWPLCAGRCALHSGTLSRAARAGPEEGRWQVSGPRCSAQLGTRSPATAVRQALLRVNGFTLGRSCLVTAVWPPGLWCPEPSGPGPETAACMSRSALPALRCLSRTLQSASVQTRTAGCPEPGLGRHTLPCLALGDPVKGCELRRSRRLGQRPCPHCARPGRCTGGRHTSFSLFPDWSWIPVSPL